MKWGEDKLVNEQVNGYTGWLGVQRNLIVYLSKEKIQTGPTFLTLLLYMLWVNLFVKLLITLICSAWA